MSNATNQLQKTVEEQLTRLLQQLQDCEELKDDLDPEEYEETKRSTLEQMKEFQQTLDKMVSGDLSLKSSLDSVRLAMQAAVSQAFHTPEVIKMFANNQTAGLRNKLAQLQMNLKLNKASEATVRQQSIEILSALKKLGDPLSAEEEKYLKDNMTNEMKQFETVDSSTNVRADQLLSKAGAQIQSSRK
eukprot:GEZU01033892.1.p1 GENE.GEZU01033892.1~~GEZU01033892.1.p1  ORF type:complete len:203 (+),score=73.67 GEZU01033892.1:47-610(+)